MKYSLLALFLAFFLTVTGCASVGRAAEDLDRKLDRVEETIESRLEDALYGTAPVTSPAVSPTATPTAPANEITAAEAEQTALSHAGFTADQVKYLRTEYEIDDGYPQYEVTFHFDRWEYDYEIDARTGNILSFEKDD